MAKIAGMIVGAIVGILLVAVVSKIANHYNDRGEKKYDERQKSIRGVGYCIALYVLIGLIFLKNLVLTGVDIGRDSMFSLDVMAMLISLFVFLAYCVMHDAYLTISERPKSVIIMTIFFAVFNFSIAWFPNAGLHGNILADSSFVNLAVATFCFGIGVMVFIKYYVLKSKEE